jgi:hypothetical protein
MIPEDPCEEFDSYDKQMMYLCWIGAIGGVLGSIVSVSHWNPIGLLCLGVSYKLYDLSKQFKDAARPQKDE